MSNFPIKSISLKDQTEEMYFLAKKINTFQGSKFIPKKFIKKD